MGMRPTIIPVASGKGGVGKSVFAASLAILLGRMGFDTIAVDLDLGGSNLHTYFGLPNTHPGVGDYLKQRLAELNQLLVDTPFPKVRFLPGDGKTPFMANIPKGQRFQLLDDIQHLPARFVVVDLGAGSSINTMNFFGLANDSIVITTLDTPALMNAMVFLRNFLFANILTLAAEDPILHRKLLDLYRRPASRKNLTAQEAYQLVSGHNPSLGRTIRSRCQRFAPRLVLNMGDAAADLAVASKIRSSLQKNLSMDVSILGMIFYDDQVRRLVRKNRVVMGEEPPPLYQACLKPIVERIVSGERAPDPETLRREAERIGKQYGCC